MYSMKIKSGHVETTKRNNRGLLCKTENGKIEILFYNPRISIKLRGKK